MKKYITIQEGFNLTLKETALLAKQAGFDGVFVSKEEGIITDDDIEYIRNIGLDIETVHLTYNTPRRLMYDFWGDTDLANDTLNILKSDIDFAFKHNIKKVVCHSSCGGPIETIPNMKGVEWYRKVCDYAKEKGIIVCFENIKHLPHTEYLLKHIDRDNAKTCFDIGHANGFTKNLDEYDWSNILNKVECVHLHDNDGSYDQHLIPGFGKIDFVKYLRKILKINPNINLTMELYLRSYRKYSYENLTPKEFFELAYKKICEIEEKL